MNEIVKQCAYWNFEKKAWAHDGLTLDLKTEKFPVCKTTHLTNFALLVVRYTDSLIFLIYEVKSNYKSVGS